MAFFKKPAAHHEQPTQPPELVVHGYDLSIRWRDGRIVVQRRKDWTDVLAFGLEACERVDLSTKTFSNGFSEQLLLIWLKVGQPERENELDGRLEILIPSSETSSLQSLVVCMRTEIARRRRAAPAEPPMAPPATPVRRVEPWRPPSEPERPRRNAEREARQVDRLRDIVSAYAETMDRDLEEPPRAVVTRPAPDERPFVAPEPPARTESPRLRRASFLQAPDDADWISFSPLRTADEVRAPLPARD